ncbi:hypothetical protein E1211_05115 [Micromonospora sp. 15K316]|uniref:hypothetical protein n=1 Tax=Micromonospora sp. 15K316 TaxID=2530376 RepID=UPI0010472693|nr:hypothetical protein [Micromonospora sp. 15K316]TDC39049.1 hypothetical protein E1211_05115 [Micromonospora sp. 15K316]
MCGIDAAAKEAAVSEFLDRHPHTRTDRSDHPALRGCAEIRWSDFSGCPAGLPAVFRGLLDEASAPDAERVLTNVLMDGVFHINAALPAALPFLLRLAADQTVPVRKSLLDIVVVAAALCQPVEEDDERAVRLLGSDTAHPERAQCRSAFAEHVSLLRVLMIDRALVNDEDRAILAQVA